MQVDCCIAGFDTNDNGPFANPVTQFNQNLFDRTRCRSRYVHGGFVRLQRHEGIIHFDDIPRLHKDFDDRNIREVTDVRHFKINELAHAVLLTGPRGGNPPAVEPDTR